MTPRQHFSLYVIMKLRRCVKCAEKWVRIGRVGALSCARQVPWVRQRLNLPRNDTVSLSGSVLPGLTVRQVDPETPFERALPYMPGELEPHETFLKEQRGTFPATFVAELRRGRFWGYYGGSVFTEDGRLVPELSKDVWGPQLHSAFVRTRLPRATWLPGRTLSLVTPEAAGNYHHWTVDLLPRAGLVQRAGYRLSEFDHVLIKHRGSPFQVEALRRLGIDTDKVIRVEDDLHLQAETLVVPAVRHDNTKVSRSDMEFVRRLYLPEEPSPTTAFRRLYVSRRDASFRRVTNEAELMPVLHEYGFEEVSMSKMSVAEQAKVFSEAQYLVGPNGSALANLVFANPACQVLEFFAPGWVVGYNWMICAAFGLPYTAVVGRGPRPAPGTLPREIKQDIYLDIELVKTALDAIPAR